MSESIKNRDSLQEILKGSLVATLLSVLFVLAFALIARIFGISAGIVPVANIIIKIVSVFLAVFVAIKTPRSGFAKGVAIGVGFVLLSTLVFWMLGGQFDFASLLTNIAIAGVTGLIAGIIAVNRKK